MCGKRTFSQAVLNHVFTRGMSSILVPIATWKALGLGIGLGLG